MYLYFSTSQQPSISPSFSGMWETTSGAVRRVLSPQKLNLDPITIGSTINGRVHAGASYLDRQYVSPGLANDQYISGLISGQLMVREYAVADNVDMVKICLNLVKRDGSIRNTLLTSGNYGPILEFVNNATHRNKTFASGQSLIPATGFAGDRLVLEVGYSQSTTAGTPQASAKYGGTGALLPINETQTTNGCPWVAITPNLVFNKTTFLSIDDF